MTTSTISSKGQTTIPVEVQRKLGVRPGDKLQYFFEEDGTVSLLPKTASISDLRGILPKPERALSVEEMEDGLAESAAERMERCSE
ncbi:MAG: AbrB/MazE/SpoVT family DNA-binding domain-containing protein [Verrucomicrobiota bacterium]